MRSSGPAPSLVIPHHPLLPKSQSVSKRNESVSLLPHDEPITKYAMSTSLSRKTSLTRERRRPVISQSQCPSALLNRLRRSGVSQSRGTAAAGGLIGQTALASGRLITRGMVRKRVSTKTTVAITSGGSSRLEGRGESGGSPRRPVSRASVDGLVAATAEVRKFRRRE